MHNDVWGEMKFHIGWKSKISLDFFDRQWDVTLKAQAYKEADGLTAVQEQAFEDFKNNENRLLTEAENKLLKTYPQASKTYRLSELLFKRDGSCALLLDSKNDPDGGIAIQLLPQLKIFEEDTFL